MFKYRKSFAAILTAGVALGAASLANAQSTSPFFLHDGDSVVMYGDEITNQGLYTVDTQAFVQSRFPKIKLSWHNAGWDGDSATGNPYWWGGGDVNTRLDRDVTPCHPDVMTVLLGNNDGGNKEFNADKLGEFTRGYRHILDKTALDDHNKVRFTLITPAAYDDVNHKPDFAGGYNGTLEKYAERVGEVARQAGAVAVDLHGSMTDMLVKSRSLDPEVSKKIMDDNRSKPNAGAHVFIASQIVKTWGMTRAVSDVAIDAAVGVVTKSENARVTMTSRKGILAWTETEGSLPLPIDFTDPATALVIKSSDIVDNLDQENLKVANLTGSSYVLAIDGASIGAFTASQLSGGINLATLQTPMLAQSMKLVQLARAQFEIESEAVHNLQIWHLHYDAPGVNDDVKKVIADLHKASTIAQDSAAKTAQPVVHKFTLTPQ